MSDPDRRFGEIVDRSFDELDARTLHDIMRLRTDVFVVEQECPYPELDGRDPEPTTRHAWITAEDGTIAAYARLLDEGGDLVRIGRVATHPDHRGHGLGAQLVRHFLHGHEGRCVLDAQRYLKRWYEGLGFAPDGEEFVEDGIAHVPMRSLG